MTDHPPNANHARGPLETEAADDLVTARPDAIEAWSRTVALHLLWIGAAAGALALQFVRLFRGLHFYSEAMDLAQLGRHLAAGDGYVTSLLRPVVVSLFEQAPAPEVVHPPLYPFALALVFGVLPESDAVVAGVSAFFFLATTALIYLLAARLFDRGAGVFAAVLFAVSTAALGYAVSGLALTLWALLVTLTFYLLFTNPGARRRSLMAGGVLGLAWLTDFMTAALIIPALAAAYYMPRARRAAHLGWFMLGLLVVMAPWWARNYRVAGDPFFTLSAYKVVMFSDAHPGHELFRKADATRLNLPALVTDSPRAVVKKGVVGLSAAYRAIPPLVGYYVAAFFVVAMIRRLPLPHANQARKFIFLWVAFMVAVGALFNPIPETFFAIVPLVIVLCGGYFMILAREWLPTGGARIAGVLLFIGLAAYPTIVSWALPPAATTLPYARRNLDYVQRATPEGTVVVSDAPWAVAWYARRPAVWLPWGEEDFEAVDAAIGVDAIYFTSLLRTYPEFERPLMWQRIYAAQVAPPGFEVVSTLPLGELLMMRRRADSQGALDHAAPGSAP